MQTSQWFYARDGQQQGPVSFEELQQLGRQGGLTPNDLVWTQTMTQWQPAGTVPGLVAAPVPPPPLYGVTGAPPQSGYLPPGQYPPPGYAPPGYAPPGAGQPMNYAGVAPPGYYAGPRDVGQDPGMRWLIPVGRSIWAIAAGYLGLLSPLMIFAPLALIFGIVAIRDIKKHPNRHGLGRAWFGIIMGVIFTVIGTIMLVNALAQPSHPARRW
jgi:hypothetical protein